jgi:O-antigen ligase
MLEDMSTTLTPSSPGALPRSYKRPWIALVFVFSIIPLTFIGSQVLGYQFSGWAWLLDLLVIGPILVSEPLHRRAVRSCLPYLLFLVYATVTLGWATSLTEGGLNLAQYVVPALAYLLAWRLPPSVALRERLRVISLRGLGVAAVLAVAFIAGLEALYGLEINPRPMAISLVVIFVVATVGSTSWRYTLPIGALALAIALGTGSRMSSAVLMVMLLVSPSLGLRLGGRIAIAAACLLLIFGLSNTQAFRERFFYTEKASLMDLVTFSDQVNTTGRRDLWPLLTRECSPHSVTGLGIGASYRLSMTLTDGGMNQPHNEYLRIYCDQGWVGTLLIWPFFAWVIVRSYRRALLSGRDASLHGAAGQLALALLIFAYTDNPLVYTAHFMTPMAVVLGLSDRAWAARGRPTHAEARRSPGAAPSAG